MRRANGFICSHRRKNNHRWKFKREWSCSVPVNRTVQYFSIPGNNRELSRPCNQQRAMGRHINGNNSQQLRDCQVVRQFTSLAASLAMFVIYSAWFNDGERIYNNFPLWMSHEPTTRADVYRVPSFDLSFLHSLSIKGNVLWEIHFLLWGNNGNIFHLIWEAFCHRETANTIIVAGSWHKIDATLALNN